MNENKGRHLGELLRSRGRLGQKKHDGKKKNIAISALPKVAT